MVLNWLHQGAVVDGSTFRPPKDLNMLAVNVLLPPEQFRVYQVFSPVSETVRRLLQQPVQRSVASIPVERGKRGTFSAVREWRLPTPTGYHFASRFMFKGDDPYEESGLIKSHRLGDLTISGNAGATFEDPTRSIPIGSNGGGSLSANFRAAVDPILVAQVLTGSELLQAVLRDVLQSLEAEGVDTHGRDFESNMQAALEIVAPLFAPPEDWFYEIGPAKFTAHEGSETRLDIAIHAGSVGHGLMAIQVADGNDPDEGAISEIISVRGEESGRLYAAAETAFGGPTGFVAQ